MLFNVALDFGRGRFAQGIIRRTHWIDTRDMLADCRTNAGIDRTLLHKVSNGCQLELAHHVLTHIKNSVGLATIVPVDDGDVVS